MWATIALSCHRRGSWSDSSSSSSGSNSQSSKTAASGDNDSNLSRSTASTRATSTKAPHSPTLTSPKALRKSLLVNYGRPHSSGSNHSIAQPNLAFKVSPPTRNARLESSSRRLQELMIQAIDATGDRQAKSPPNRASQPNFSRRRTYERKHLTKVLLRALEDSTHESRANSDHPIHFMLKKKYDIIGPPSFKRSGSSSSSSSTFDTLLKESRREQLMETLQNPTCLRNLNTSSLRDSFHSVHVIGANQQGRRSSAAEQQQSMSTACFHEAVCDFSVTPAALAVKRSKATTVSQPVQKDDPKVFLNPSSPSKPSCIGKPTNKCRSLKNFCLSGEESSYQQRKRHQQKPLMNRSNSAPRQSIKWTSGSSLKSLGMIDDQAASEIAALRALAGRRSSAIIRRPSTATLVSSSIPTTIAVLKRSTSCPASSASTASDSSSTNSKDSLPLSKLRPKVSLSTMRKIRRDSLQRLKSCTILQRDVGCNGAGTQTRHRCVQNVASLGTSRKSLSLMIQNAKLRDSHGINNRSNSERR